MNFKLLFFLFVVNGTYSQIDSIKLKTLNEAFANAGSDSEKVMTLTEIAWLHRKFDKKKHLSIVHPPYH